MTTNHLELVQQAFDANPLPPTPRAVDSITPILVWLLGHLPAAEQAGYTKSSAGASNTIQLADGTYVRVARVSYPDGQIYKFMSDVPNGGPQWVAEDVRPDLYLPVAGPIGPESGTPSADLTPVLVRLAALEASAGQLTALFAELVKQIGIINQQVADLTNRPAPPPPALPTLYVTVFGIRIPVRVG